MSVLPETVLQFGAGNFLRAFCDLFIQQANEGATPVGKIVVVQSTDSGRADALSAQNGRYHVAVRGVRNGQVVDESFPVEAISRAVSARSDWPAVLELARSPQLRYLLSNTTEAGFALHPADRPTDSPPASFPAKLCQVLAARQSAGLPGLIILPCELIERNGDRLKELVLQQAAAWAETAPQYGSSAFLEYVQHGCRWLNSLVDRIVTGKPAEHPLLASDPLLTAAEPFALWAIEGTAADLGPLVHPAIRVVPDVQPYSLRKIRILNGAHTALVSHALPLGFQTVREAVADKAVGDWLRGLLNEEIIPLLRGRVDDPDQFARDTLDRFANPFLNHRLSDIALNHAAKLKTRLLPTWKEWLAQGQRLPRLEQLLQQQVAAGHLAASDLDSGDRTASS